MAKAVKITLNENEMPTRWYNVRPDLPEPLPLHLHPGTHQPITAQDAEPLFPRELIAQELNDKDRYIDIPEEVQDILRMWRPTPVQRAYRLEKALDTPAKIYYKYEGVSPAGSHKLNTAVAAAYYNKKQGVKRIATETGAGQWGSALSLGCQLFGLECKVYMVKVSYNQKPYRRTMMEVWGGKVVASPSKDTKAGQSILAQDPNSPGSLGIAISEAIEDAVTTKDTKYALGSVLNHVILHQTVVGQEAKKQMEKAGDYPDIIVGCIGGGSNFAGMVLPFVKDRVSGKKIRLIAVEPSACPSLTKGPLAYDFGDTVGMTPLLKMYTLGHSFMPPSIHAGGLRYHGMAPIVSHLYKLGLIEAQAIHQTAVFKSAITFARSEGIIPAPESAHAVSVAIDEAIKCKEAGQSKTILIALSGHGHFDLGAYDEYLTGKLQDYEYPTEKVKEALASLPKV